MEEEQPKKEESLEDNQNPDIENKSELNTLQNSESNDENQQQVESIVSEDHVDTVNDKENATKISLLAYMEKIGMPADNEFIDKCEDLSQITLKRIIILFKAIAQQKIYHDRLNSQFKKLNSSVNLDKTSEDELTSRLTKNLEQLEETKLKKLLYDLTERFLLQESIQDEPENEIDELESLEALVLNIETLQSQLTKLSDENQRNKEIAESTPKQNEPEQIVPVNESLSEIIEQKNLRIQELENEVQEKIRIIESNSNDILQVEKLRKDKSDLDTEINQLKSELQTKRTEFDIFREENHIFQNQLNKLESEIEQKNSLISTISKEIAELKNTKEDYQNICNDFEKIVGEKHEIQDKSTVLIEKLNEAEQNNQEQQKLLNKYEDDKNHAQKQLEIKKTQIDELSAEIKLKNENIANLRTQMAEQLDDTASFADLERKLAEKDVLITDLQEEIRNYENKLSNMVYREELDQYKSQISNLESQLEEKRQKIQTKQEEMVALRGEFANSQLDFQSQIDGLKKSLSQKEELKILIREQEEAMRDFERQEEEFHEALLDKVRLTAEKEDMTDQLNEIINQKRVLFDRIAELNNRDSGHLAIIKRLEEKRDRLETQLEDFKSGPTETLKEQIEREFLQNQIDKMNQDLREQIGIASESKGKLEVFQDQYNLLQQKTKHIEDDYNSLEQTYKSEKRQYEEQIKALNSEISELINNSKDNRQKIDELTISLEGAVSGEEFQSKIDSIQKNLEERQRIIEEKSQTIVDKELKIEKLQQDSTRLEEEIIHLKRRIKVLRRDLARQ